MYLYRACLTLIGGGWGFGDREGWGGDTHRPFAYQYVTLLFAFHVFSSIQKKKKKNMQSIISLSCDCLVSPPFIAVMSKAIVTSSHD